jgi:hypothetical protein
MTSDPEFLFGPVPHEEAAAFIKGKPVVSKEVLEHLLPVLKARAFVIAGEEKARVAPLPRGKGTSHAGLGHLSSHGQYVWQATLDDDHKAPKIAAARKLAFEPPPG